MSTAPTVTSAPSAPTTGVLPRWLWLAAMSVVFVLGTGIAWSIAQTQAVCEGYGVDAILPGPQLCGPDAQLPALVTAVLLMLALAAAFVVAFTLERRRTLVLALVGAGMLLIALVGILATVATASFEPPVIYY